LEALGKVVCTRCGSLRTRVIAGGLVERAVALLLRQDVVACVRCGFRGRQPKARKIVTSGRRSASSTAGGPPIDLAALDRKLDHADGASTRAGDD
jgi:hypothetical protein